MSEIMHENPKIPFSASSLDRTWPQDGPISIFKKPFDFHVRLPQPQNGSRSFFKTLVSFDLDLPQPRDVFKLFLYLSLPFILVEQDLRFSLLSQDSTLRT